MSVQISLWRKIGKLEPNLLHQPFEKKAMNITAADWSQVSTLVSEATEWNFENQTPARLFTNRPWFTCVAQLVALVLMANPVRSTCFYTCLSAGAWMQKRSTRTYKESWNLPSSGPTFEQSFREQTYFFLILQSTSCHPYLRLYANWTQSSFPWLSGCWPHHC